MFTHLPLVLTLLIGVIAWFLIHRHRIHAEHHIEKLCRDNLLTTIRYHNPVLKESCAYHVIHGSLQTRLRTPLPLELTPARHAVMDSLALGLLCAVTIELRDPFVILSALAEHIRVKHNVATSVFVNDKGAMELVIREPAYELYYFVFDSRNILI